MERYWDTKMTKYEVVRLLGERCDQLGCSSLHTVRQICDDFEKGYFDEVRLRRKTRRGMVECMVGELRQKNQAHDVMGFVGLS